jgi:hypothetical protein
MESTFDVLVGTGELQKRFTLHTDFFIPRFEFFKAARSAAWNTDPLKPSTLDNKDDDPAGFSHYARCVYLNNVDFLPHAEESTKPHFTSLLRLYILADRLGDLKTANMVIDRLVSYSDEVKRIPGSDDIRLSYNFTASGSPLRAVLRDQFIHEVSANYFQEHKAANSHREFLQDIVVGYLDIKETTNVDKSMSVGDAFRVKVSSMDDGCFYHQHNQTVPRCSPSQSPPVEVVHID